MIRRSSRIMGEGFYVLDIEPGYQHLSLWEHNGKGASKKLSTLSIAITPFKPEGTWIGELRDFLSRHSLKPQRSLIVTIPSIYTQTLTLPKGFSSAQIQTALLSEAEQLYLFQNTVPVVRWHPLHTRAGQIELMFSAQPKPLLQGIQQAADPLSLTLQAIIGSDALLLRAPLHQVEGEPAQSDKHQKIFTLLITDHLVTLATLHPTGQWLEMRQTPFPGQMENPLDDIAPWAARYIKQDTQENRLQAGWVINRCPRISQTSQSLQTLQRPLGSSKETSSLFWHWQWCEGNPDELMVKTLSHILSQKPGSEDGLFYFYSNNPDDYPEGAEQSRIQRYRSFIRGGLLLLNVLTLLFFFIASLFFGVLNQQTHSRMQTTASQIESLTQQSATFKETALLFRGVQSNASCYNWLVHGGADWATFQANRNTLWASPLVSLECRLDSRAPDIVQTVIISQVKPQPALLDALKQHLPQSTLQIQASPTSRQWRMTGQTLYLHKEDAP